MGWLDKIAAEAVQLLGKDASSRTMPPVPPPPEDPLAEAEEIACPVREKGICLLWAGVLEDYIAFVRDEEDAAQVPPGYVIYTERQLQAVFGERNATRTSATLRLIHEAKRHGAVVKGRPVPTARRTTIASLSF